MNETDGQLVGQSQRGDRAAFEELLRRNARAVFARLYLETGDVHRAEDLSQETFLSAWRHIHQVSDGDGFRAWLFALAHSALIDAVRRERRRKRFGRHEPADAMSGVVDGSARPPDESAERDEARQRVLAVLRSMPDEYRLPLTLRYIGGADYESIGRQLGLTNGSLRGLLNRGMARLRAAMTNHAG